MTCFIEHAVISASNSFGFYLLLLCSHLLVLLLGFNIYLYVLIFEILILLVPPLYPGIQSLLFYLKLCFHIWVGIILESLSFNPPPPPKFLMGQLHSVCVCGVISMLVRMFQSIYKRTLKSLNSESDFDLWFDKHLK